MKKVMMFLGSFLIFSLFPLTDALGQEACDSVKKAKSLWEYNMPQKALTCLDAVIEKKPTSTEAHFLKGKYCLQLGNYTCADSRFRAKPVRARYSQEIILLYEQDAEAKLNQGRVSAAGSLYNKVIEHGGFNRSNVCQIFYNRGNSVSDASAFDYYMAARQFCGNKHDQAIGEKFMSIAQVKSVSKRKPWLDKAAHFISWDEIHAVFPAPTKKVVFQKSYVGQGTDDAYVIKTIQGGKDVQDGDTVRLTGSHFWVGINGKWKESKGWIELTDLHLPIGEHLPIAAKKGVSIEIKVTRKTRSY